MIKPWKILRSRMQFTADPWIRIFKQKIQLPDGRIINDYHQIKLQNYAIIVAFTKDNRIVFERQYKHGLKQVSPLLPCGAIEDGESPLETAKRELLEETGYHADNWLDCGSYVCDGTYGCGTAHLFVARNASKVAEPNNEDLEEMEIKLITLDDAMRAVASAKITVVAVVMALALAANPLFIKLKSVKRRGNKQ